jgi:hypothetical protein
MVVKVSSILVNRHGGNPLEVYVLKNQYSEFKIISTKTKKLTSLAVSGATA